MPLEKHLNFTVLLTLLIITVNVQANSIYKCTDKKGRVAFSGTPCSKSAEKMDIDVPHIGTSGAVPTKDVLKRLENSNRLIEIDRQIKQLKKNIHSYQRKMDAQIARLRNSKQYAANNLAGATWEESISAASYRDRHVISLKA